MSSRPSIDKYFVDMLDLVASRSTCARRRVAALLVDDTGKLLSMGYNGVPRGMDHCIDRPCSGALDIAGNNARCMAIHAEQNAIIQAGDRASRAHTLYCSTTPCFNCAKLLISCGIKFVVFQTIYADMMGIQLLTRAGIQLFSWDDESGARRAIPQTLLDEAMDL